MSLSRFFENNQFQNQTAIISEKLTLNYNDKINKINNISKLSFIIYSSNLSFVFCNLLKIDGCAKAVCLLPVGLEFNELSSILQSYKFDFIITDEEIIFNKKFDLIILKNVDEILRLKFNEFRKDHNYEKIETNWLIPTSGTTGTPKLVIHTFLSLTNSLKRSSNKSDIRNWGLLYDHCRFAGLQVILQSLFNHDKLIAPKNIWPLDKKLSFLKLNKCNYLSATPTLWRKILMSEYSNQMDFKQITLGGESADQIILSNLKKQYPNARITHVYASTEFGVVLSASDIKEGFPKSYLNKNHNGFSLKIDKNELLIKNKILKGRYTTGKNFLNNDNWINSGDIVKIKEGRIIITGRINGLIIVGGDKIMPNEVKKTLLGCDIVSDAIVYGKSSPITGQLVAAKIALKDKDIDNEKAKLIILNYSKKYLKRFELPRYINIVDDISINDSGKGV